VPPRSPSFLALPRPPTSTLFPYTTLFRSSGPVNAAQIADPPEWGGLLAAARTIESLWTFRWLILVPGLAFAATAIAISLVGFALARRYARRDVIEDLSSRGALAVCALAIVL